MIVLSTAHKEEHFDQLEQALSTAGEDTAA